MDIITYGLLNKRIKKKADLDSPHFTGTPTAPTPESGDESERLATTEFVQDAIKDIGPGTVYTLTREGKFIVLDGGGSLQSQIELPYTYMTTEEWDATSPMISESGALYIWSDYRQDEKGNNIPGVKIGDGNAYIKDLPFQDEDFLKHILNTDIHVTPAEKEFWNNKVTCYIPKDDPTRVVFTKDNIITIEGGNG